MLFIVCMAIRLARFNTSIVESSEAPKKPDQRFFIGVPAPSGALLSLVPLILDFGFTSNIENFTIRNYTLLIDFYIFGVLCRRKQRDAQMRATINEKLVETGERDR